MNKAYLVFALLLLTLNSQTNTPPTCAKDNSIDFVSGSLTVSASGNVRLVQGQDIQCYNHTVQKPFSCSPNVAIAVNDLESHRGNHLFFAIKAIHSDNLGIIPFIIRTHFGYTRWNKISFSFFAQTNRHIHAGYYQIDTASLSGCGSGRSIAAFIPYQNNNAKLTASLVFLNGFEVSSVLVNSSYASPFEVQVVSSALTAQGITVLLSTTSATQVHSVFVSYIVYDPSIPNLVAGNYLYKQYKASNSLAYRPPIGISNNNAAFHGFSGFIVNNNNANLALSGNLNNGELAFVTSSNYYYLSYSYFYLIGGPCGQCIGNNVAHQGKCIASCPAGTNYNGNICLACTSSQQWDIKTLKCVDITNPNNPNNPNNPTNPDNIGKVPSCPSGTFWDEQQLRCLPCVSGCSQCVDCDVCIRCSAGFNLNVNTGLCNQICGDGRRFILGCDDGNLVNGDGCSSTCQVESGFFCTGGSPARRDSCSKETPTKVVLSSSGQSHTWGQIVANVRVNYLPQAVIAQQCNRNRCDNLLRVVIIDGDVSATSIRASYIQGSSFSFSIVFDFQKEPIGLFTAQVSLQPNAISKHFGKIDATHKLRINVNPAMLAIPLFSSDNLE